jgi:hypothetical protein
MGRKPTSINQAFYGLLLVQVELEERVADVAELLFGVAAVEVPTDSLQLELATGGEHDTDEADDDSEEVVFSTLHYYMVAAVPGLLGIARFHASDDETGFYDVTEDAFLDSAEDFSRLQYEVTEALEMGVDVCVLSSYSPDNFPKINSYLEEASHADE